MARVNWSTAAAAAVTTAKARGKEGNITQFRNAMNDLARYLTIQHKPWEILEGIYRLARQSR